MVAPALIGAGLGLASHLFGGGGGSQSSTTTMSPEDAEAIRWRRAFAQNQVNMGMPQLDPSIIAAMSGYGRYAGAGQMGLDAFTDPAIMAKFGAGGNEMANPIFDYQRMQRLNDYRKAMTGQRAFGVRGSMMGPDYGDIDRAQLGFGIENLQNARNIAAQFANFGQFGIAGQHNLGQWMTNRPMEFGNYGVGLLSNAFGQPISTTSSQSNPNDRGNLFQSVLGGAAFGQSFAGAPAPAPSSSVVSGLHSQGYGWGGYKPPQFGEFGGYRPQVGPTGFGQGAY